MKRFLPVLLLVAVGYPADEVVRGVVLDPDGRPLAGARVTLRTPDGCCLFVEDHSFRRATTDERGRFEFDRPPEAMEVSAEHPDFGPVWGRAEDGAVLRLRRAAYVEGTVSTSARIRALLGMRLLAGVESDGAFRLGPLPPGRTFLLTAASAGHRPYRLKLTLEEGETRRLDILLADGLTLEGRIVPATAGVVLRASQGELRESTATARADGSFTISGLRPGAVRVVVLCGDREPRIVDGVAGETIEVRLDR